MYESFYGLTGAPFRLSPDPEFFFGSKGHTKALAYLRYGITQKEGFVVITGAPGTGKTTLARALLKELGKEKVVVSEINTTHLESDDMLRLTAASFGLAHDGVSKSTLLKSLESFFIGRFRAGYHALLLVDESQNLPATTVEELRMLSNFHVGNHPLVQIFLMGQEQFRDTLQSDRMEQLRQRVVASCHLVPLDVTETREYIEHRLRFVGWKGDPAFTEQAFVRIFGISKGVPRRINTFCDRLMLYSSLEGLHEITDQTVNTVAHELLNEVSSFGIDAGDLGDAAPTGESVPAATVASAEPTAIASSPHKSIEPGARVVPETVARPTAKPSAQSAFAMAETPSVSVTLDDQMSSRAPELSSMPLMAEASLPELETLVACFQYGKTPSKYPRMSDPKAPLPSGLTEVLRLAVGKLELSNHLLTERFGGASIAEVRAAVRDYVKNVLLSGTADYYRRLGIPRDADIDLAKRHYKYLFRLFQPDQEKDPTQWNEIYARRINQAYATLRDPKKRASYDEFLATYEKRGGPSGSRMSDTMVTALVDQDTPRPKPEGKPLPALRAEPESRRMLEPEPVKSSDPVSFAVPKVSQKRRLRVLYLGLAVLLVAIAVALTQTNIGGRIADVFSGGKPGETVALSPVAEPTLEPSAPPSAPVEPEVTVENVVATTTDGTTASNAVPDAQAKPALVAPAIEPAPIDTEARPSKSKRKSTESQSSAGSSTTTSSDTGVAEAPVESAPVSATLSERDLRQTLNTLTSAYESGDLNRFMAVFGANASTNDRQDKAGIENDYRELFAGTESRAMELKRLRWVRGVNSASAKGDFKVSVVRKGSADTKNFSGTIDIDFEKIDGQIKITGFHHSYVADAAR